MSKPLADLVPKEIDDTIWELYALHVGAVITDLRAQAKRSGVRRTGVNVYPPSEMSEGVIAKLVQVAGVYERITVLDVVKACVDDATYARVKEAVKSQRGPVEHHRFTADWVKVSASEDGKTQAYKMRVNSGYALAK